LYFLEFGVVFKGQALNKPDLERLKGKMFLSIGFQSIGENDLLFVNLLLRLKQPFVVVV
jgi:hypothetical protein